jgi:predicted RNA-binding Zn-ribbon protein involved in translation (DUF1610 family)
VSLDSQYRPAPSTGSTRSWLALSVAGKRHHGGNDGYDDEPSEHYTWDSTVANHAQVKIGDSIVLWDRDLLLGASTIDAISRRSGIKTLYSCPKCGRAKINARVRSDPAYKCYACGNEFDEARTNQVPVIQYASQHSALWEDLRGLLPGSELRALCVSPKSQHSLRPFNWDAFNSRITGSSEENLVRQIGRVSQLMRGGHRDVIVRARVGQSLFRAQMLKAFGAVCAFTGESPASALEAAHLYSYAQVGEHREHGGLLLRRDLHRLFDLGHLSIEPTRLTVDVGPEIRGYAEYGRLHGLTLAVSINLNARAWVAQHWAQHRP